jgi:hypothetical protein
MLKAICIGWLGLSLALVACGGGEASGEDVGSGDGAFSTSDFTEDQVLPYVNGWVDPATGLAGVGQFDRLHSTIHDDVKCSTMVAIAAGVVGGEKRFLALLDAVAKHREGMKDDLAVIQDVRDAVAAKQLTPRLIHELTDVMVRAFGLLGGALDSQIAAMVRDSGWQAVHVGSSKPQDLVDSLKPGEIVPLGIIADGEGHITLLWKDGQGTVRLYDSDDVHGSHVMPRGSAPYNKRLEDPQSSWDRREKYQLP